MSPRKVSSLLGHRHVEMAILCLGSLLRASAEPLALRLHDDGSLTAEDRERLAAALEEPEIITRTEADERVADILKQHPALAAFRRTNPLALKLIDVVQFAGEELAYCDTDILFLRPFTGLFPERAGTAFMADHQNAYSLRSWHLLLHRRLRLPRHVNSGLIHFPSAAWDPDLLEWYLSRPEFAFAPVWVEQTAWALLGERAGCRLFDPARIRIPEAAGKPGDEREAETVALHFVGPVRDLLGSWAAQATLDDRRLPAEIGRVAAGRCGVVDLAVTEARRRLGRL
jgi:hypothetical protein